MNLDVICAMQIILGTYGRHLHQHIEEHSIIGKRVKDKRNLRPSNIREKFKVLNAKAISTF